MAYFDHFATGRSTGFGDPYRYSGFRGAAGFMLNRMVKSATFWASGEDLDFKPYKLRLTFLRRFMIVGRKEPA